jgi:hypothetical protein
MFDSLQRMSISCSWCKAENEQDTDIWPSLSLFIGSTRCKMLHVHWWRTDCLREDSTPSMYSQNVQGLGLRFHEPKVSFELAPGTPYPWIYHDGARFLRQHSTSNTLLEFYPPVQLMVYMNVILLEILGNLARQMWRLPYSGHATPFTMTVPRQSFVIRDSNYGWWQM